MATPPVFSAGAVLTAAQMNKVGMWLVKTDTITSGTSKEITGAFNSDFRNYRVVVSDIQFATFTNLMFRFGTSAGNNYYGSQYYDLHSGAGTGTNRSSAGTGLYVGGAENFTNDGVATFDVLAPNTAQSRKTITGTFFGAGYSGWFGGTLVSTTAFTSFTLYTLSGTTISNCNIYVYGYRP